MIRPRIAFLTATDATDRTSWSGIPYYMARALDEHVGCVHYLGPLDLWPYLLPGKVWNRVSRTIFHRGFEFAHREALSRAYAEHFSARLKHSGCDIIVALAAATEIAYLETNIPIVYLSDTTFAKMVDYYPTYMALWPESVRQGNAIERRAITRSALALFPTRWATDSAVADYGAPVSKVHTIPFGANIDVRPPLELIVRNRAAPMARMLFLGVEWHRKGGDVALQTLIELLRLGIPAELTICGCRPPVSMSHPRMRIIPFIDKNDPAQRERFEDLMWHSDLMIAPTRAECFGIAFCEAAAFGLPVFTAHTGGVPESVKEGASGFLLPPNATGADYAKQIAALIQDPACYQRIVRSSAHLSQTTFNWDVWGAAVGELIHRIAP